MMVREAIVGEKWCFFEHCSNGGGGQPMFKNYVGNCRVFWRSFNNIKFAWKGTFEALMVKFGGEIGTLLLPFLMLKSAFKKYPLQNRTNVQIKGGGQRPFEQCSKKLHFSYGSASLKSLCGMGWVLTSRLRRAIDYWSPTLQWQNWAPGAMVGFPGPLDQDCDMK